MQQQNIPFRDTGYISKLICDYTNRDSKIENLYNQFPDLDGFKKQIKLKGEQFSLDTRKVLVEALKEQYANTKISDSTKIATLGFQNFKNFLVKKKISMGKN